MIEQFACARGLLLSEFLDLNHTSIISFTSALSIAKLAEKLVANADELRDRALVLPMLRAQGFQPVERLECRLGRQLVGVDSIDRAIER